MADEDTWSDEFLELRPRSGEIRPASRSSVLPWMREAAGADGLAGIDADVEPVFPFDPALQDAYRAYPQDTGLRGVEPGRLGVERRRRDCNQWRRASRRLHSRSSE